MEEYHVHRFCLLRKIKNKTEEMNKNLRLYSKELCADLVMQVSDKSSKLFFEEFKSFVCENEQRPQPIHCPPYTHINTHQ